MGAVLLFISLFLWPLVIGLAGSIHALFFWLPLWPFFKLVGKGALWSRWHRNTHIFIWSLPKKLMRTFAVERGPKIPGRDQDVID